jgi:CheY-like chemotaxis protein
MAQMRRDYTVLCADPSPDRLVELTGRLQREGFAVIPTESASQCLASAVQHKPNVVILDLDLLHVDQENMAEYINRICSARILLTADDPSRWHKSRPLYVEAVAERGNFEVIVSLVHQLRLGERDLD